MSEQTLSPAAQEKQRQARLIKHGRADAGLTQQALAYLIGIHVSAVRKHESETNGYRPSKKTLNGYCQHLPTVAEQLSRSSFSQVQPSYQVSGSSYPTQATVLRIVRRFIEEKAPIVATAALGRARTTLAAAERRLGQYQQKLGKKA